MKEYKYVIIGGGMTGSAAVIGIRKNDPSGSIALFSEEKYSPYNRPPLTKGLWNDTVINDIVRPMDKYDVDLFLENSIKSLGPEKNLAITEDGETYAYEKLLLATGGHPIHLPDTPEGVIYYRTRADYHKLRELIKEKQDFCVIGGGFIGSEITAALAKNDKNVTMIFPEIGISGRILPDDLSEYINQYYENKGVRVLAGNLVQAMKKENGKYLVRYKKVNTGDEMETTFDVVIVGVGIKPNVVLAQDAGITVENGIVVNEFLQTDYPNIFAAGDVANFFNPALKERTRVEHEDNANTMGLAAGQNMSGEAQPYDHFPFFYSDLFDLGYEAVGEMNKDYDIYEDWVEPFKKGAIFYLDQGRIKGLIFWNLWDKVDQGREIIAKDEPHSKLDLKGLFIGE